MNNPNDPRWNRHMADEATAIAEQQASAGASHSPVKDAHEHGELDQAATAHGQARADCAAMLQALIQDFRSRGQDAIPTAELEALADRMRAPSPGA